eukprot:COSAG02_NODE_263_length_26627_cov_47.198168_25_plen_71_part_00
MVSTAAAAEQWQDRGWNSDSRCFDTRTRADSTGYGRAAAGQQRQTTARDAPLPAVGDAVAMSDGINGGSG